MPCSSSRIVGAASVTPIRPGRRVSHPSALRSDSNLLAGLNVYAGQITHAAVAAALGIKYVEAARAIGGV